MTALRSARPFLRRELAQRLRLRNTPDLEFEEDRTIERAQALTDIMRENARQRGESL
jgi:ribosome-binding factor A